MSQLLKSGQTLQLVDGETLKVLNFLGGGGQGEVYRISLGTEDYALKWYFDQQATPEHLKNIEKLVEVGAPSKQFLWPISIVVNGNHGSSFGYIMRLRTSEYKSLPSLMKRKTNHTFYTLITAAYQLADSFQQLHAKGLCYRDISFGNVFFHDKTGDVLICDNDNVAPNGKSIKGVIGTPRFMAPEIVRAEAEPSTDTDLFSLSALLFYMLLISHPLEGRLEANIKCFDQPAMNQLYGTAPVFIFDLQDDRNRPVQGYQDNAIAYWNVYPKFLKDLFIKAFTQGLKPAGRIREIEWKQALIQLRDSIIECPSCTAENFADPEVTADQRVCWSCKRPLPIFMMLKLGRQHIPLHAKTRLYPHHLQKKTHPYDFPKELAIVAQHPQDPSIWGLKNLSSAAWQFTSTNGNSQVIESGRSVRLALGTKVSFGELDGEIV